MKKLLLAGLLLAGLSGCSKGGGNSAPTPATPALTGNTWVWTSGTLVSTNKNTGVSTTQSKTVIPNTVKLTYTTSGTYTSLADKSVSSTGADIVTTGTYSYSAGTISHTTGGKTTTARVDVLTNSNLTLVRTDDSGSMHYVTTDTYAR